MLEISSSKEEKWENKKDKSWCCKEGEVMSGGRWPVSEGANLPPMQPSWESAHTAPALRRDPQIIQTLGKAFHKRKMGGDWKTMSHMEKLQWFHPGK